MRRSRRDGGMRGRRAVSGRGEMGRIGPVEGDRERSGGGAERLLEVYLGRLIAGGILICDVRGDGPMPLAPQIERFRQKADCFIKDPFDHFIPPLYFVSLSSLAAPRDRRPFRKGTDLRPRRFGTPSVCSG